MLVRAYTSKEDVTEIYVLNNLDRDLYYDHAANTRAYHLTYNVTNLRILSKSRCIHNVCLAM